MQGLDFRCWGIQKRNLGTGTGPCCSCWRLTGRESALLTDGEGTGKRGVAKEVEPTGRLTKGLRPELMVGGSPCCRRGRDLRAAPQVKARG